jgi:phage terminase large subunit GpA-like protein
MGNVVMPAETLESLPPFVDPRTIFARASAALLPRKRMKVSEAAEKYRFIATGGQVGMWRNSTAPYLAEPMDLTSSPDHEAVVFVGPSRSGKTAGMVLNSLVHKIVCDPADTMILHTDMVSVRLFSMRDLDPMNEQCPEVAARLSVNRNEDNIYDKRYRGMLLVLTWPTINQLSSKDYEFVLITEYDRMPDDLNGEGSVFLLAKKRTQTFGSRGMTVVECSPGRTVIVDPDRPWTPKGHEAPPTTGILDLFNQGDRRLYYWPCPDCGEFFAASFWDLTWPKNGDGSPEGGIEAAAAKTTMLCPHCGSYDIEERRRLGMYRNAQWLREGIEIDKYGNITGDPRRSRIGSFWLKGPAAAWQSWESMVANYLAAVETFDRTGDTAKLKTVTNTDMAEPFEEPAKPGTEALDAALIRARQEQTWSLRSITDGVRALVITVDVQGRYFDVQVTGIGEEFETWIVDRFQIMQSAEPHRMVDPGSYAEDWNLLWPLLDQVWPFASDPTRGLAALCMLVDSAGAAGVTGNAYKFAAAARKRGISDNRLMLLKGDVKVGAKRVAIDKIDWKVSGRLMSRGLRLLKISSNHMKDDVAGALRRETPGPGYVHTPHDLNDEWYAQVTAEQRDENGIWDKRSSGARNEAFDHMCYARAAVIRPPWRWDRIDWKNVPTWALTGSANSNARATRVIVQAAKEILVQVQQQNAAPHTAMPGQRYRGTGRLRQ